MSTSCQNSQDLTCRHLSTIFDAQKVFQSLNYLGFCASCFVGRDSLKGQSFEHLKQHFMWLQTHSSLSDFNCSDVNAHTFWIHMVVFNSKMCSTAMDGGDSQWQQGYSQWMNYKRQGIQNVQLGVQKFFRDEKVGFAHLSLPTSLGFNDSDCASNVQSKVFQK